MNKMYLGDCLDILLNDNFLIETIDIRPFKVCIIDPPYGYQHTTNRRVVKDSKFTEPIINDGLDNTVRVIFNSLTRLKPLLSPDSFIYIFTSWKNFSVIKEVVENAIGTINTVLIWDKTNKGSGDLTIWGEQYEMIMFKKNGNAKVNKRLGNVITVPRIISKVHKHEKPVRLMKQILQNSGQPKDSVIDMFAGTGTTCIAAKELNWNSVGIEIDYNYFNYANQRLIQEELL